MKRQKREDKLGVRMSRAERRRVEAAAKKNGLTVADYCRRRITGALLTDKRKPKRGQEDAPEAPEGRTAGFIAEHGRPPASEQELWDWWLEQPVDDEMEAALAESDKRMAALEADRAQFEANRLREGSVADQIRPSMPGAKKSSPETTLSSEAQKIVDVQKAIEREKARTANLTGIVL